MTKIFFINFLVLNSMSKKIIADRIQYKKIKSQIDRKNSKIRPEFYTLETVW
jgi:hypothetical protein